MLKNKGQSILEYVVVLIAIIGVIAWAATKFIATGENAEEQRGVSQLMQQTGKSIESATGEIAKIGE